MKNLAAIPNKVHNFKTQISNDLGRAGASISSFASELNNEPGFEPDGTKNPAWFAFAIKAYILAHKSIVMDVIHEIAVELGRATNDDPHIYAYATDNMQAFYRNSPAAIDQWLYKWHGVPIPPASQQSSSSPPQQSSPPPASTNKPKCALQ